MRNPVDLLRAVAMWEGVSFLVLLGIAMPLKYVWQMPMAVKIVGSLHGALFVAFCIVLMRAKILAKLSTGQVALIFIASMLPFGPFVIDRRVKNWGQTPGA
jgi:integral membrane protein